MNSLFSRLRARKRTPDRPRRSVFLERFEERTLLTSYEVIDLSSLGGNGDTTAAAINASGQVVGTSPVASGVSHAFLYADGVMTDPATAGLDWSTALRRSALEWFLWAALWPLVRLLARFQAETRSGMITLGPEAFDEWIRPTFHRYRAEAGWSGWESDLLDHLSDLCTQLSGTRVPVVAVHGDYAPANILLDAGQVSGVVDWELGRRAGLPFSDLLKFAASYGSYLDRASPPARGSLAGHPGWSQVRDRWGTVPGWTNGRLPCPRPWRIPTRMFAPPPSSSCRTACRDRRGTSSSRRCGTTTIACGSTASM